jgi:hypothetical protein
MVGVTSGQRNATAQRVAGFVTGIVIFALVVYIQRHQLASTFHIH